MNIGFKFYLFELCLLILMSFFVNNSNTFANNIKTSNIIKSDNIIENIGTNKHIQNNFLNIGNWSYLNNQQFQLLKDNNIKIFRAGIFWDDIEYQDNQYNWTYTDELFKNASINNSELLLVLNNCTVWACGIKKMAPYQHIELYKDFINTFNQRYGIGGYFYRENNLNEVKIYWQIFNEVNAGIDWPNINPDDYANFLNQLYIHIKSLNSTYLIVSAGLTYYRANNNGYNSSVFLKKIYKNPKFKNSYDIFAFHAYTKNYNSLVEILNRTHKIRRLNKDYKKMWITELGWSSRDSLQNQNLNKSLIILKNCAFKWNLEKTFWFALKDIKAYENDHWGLYTGLFDYFNNPKKAWFSFIKINQADNKKCSL